MSDPTLSRDDILILIRQIFSLPADFTFTPGLRTAFIPGWDSLGWMKVVLTVEERIGRSLPLELFDTTSTVDDVCDALIAYAAGQESRDA